MCSAGLCGIISCGFRLVAVELTIEVVGTSCNAVFAALNCFLMEVFVVV